MENSSMQQTPSRLYLLTESPLTAQVLTTVFDQQVDLECSGWTRCDLEALFDSKIQQADLILIDLASLEGFDPDFARQLREIANRAKFLAIGVSGEKLAIKMIEAGVDGLTMTSASIDEVLSAARSVLRGETVCCPRILARVFDRIGKLARHERQQTASSQNLSPRERQVLDLLAQGLRNKEIASSLGIAFSTAKNHVQNLMEKLEAGNRNDAIRRACERGLLEFDMPWQSA